jgi:hypothetical protein
MPRNEAISRKFEKKPMYLTLAGIQRMSSSSTYRMMKLVRNSLTSLRARNGTEVPRPRPNRMAVSFELLGGEW